MDEDAVDKNIGDVVVFIAQAARQYGKKLNFHFNSYDGLDTVFISTLGTRIVDGGYVAEINLEKTYDEAEKLNSS